MLSPAPQANQHARGVRTKMITAIHHVNVTVAAELETAAKNFYGAVLGLKQIPKPADVAPKRRVVRNR